MIAYGISRLVKIGAQLCGASAEDADGYAFGAAGLLTVIDPIGGPLGMAHAGVSTAGRNGNTVCQKIDHGMTLVALAGGMGGGDVPDAPDAPDVDA